MSDFKRELLSATSAVSGSGMEGGAKKKGSKKTIKKNYKKSTVVKKDSKKSMTVVKKNSKKGSRRQKREIPQWMQDMMQVKKAVKTEHSDVKDGPALTKLVMEHIKSSGGVKGAIDSLMKMSGSDIKSKLEKLTNEMAAKRAAKKSV